MTTATATLANTSTSKPYAFIATCGLETVTWADTADELIAQVQAIHERGESVALWELPGRMIAYVATDGTLVRL